MKVFYNLWQILSVLVLEEWHWIEIEKKNILYQWQLPMECFQQVGDAHSRAIFCFLWKLTTPFVRSNSSLTRFKGFRFIVVAFFTDNIVTSDCLAYKCWCSTWILSVSNVAWFSTSLIKNIISKAKLGIFELRFFIRCRWSAIGFYCIFMASLVQ